MSPRQVVRAIEQGGRLSLKWTSGIEIRHFPELLGCRKLYARVQNRMRETDTLRTCQAYLKVRGLGPS